MVMVDDASPTISRKRALDLKLVKKQPARKAHKWEEVGVEADSWVLDGTEPEQESCTAHNERCHDTTGVLGQKSLPGRRLDLSGNMA